jgi:hypothetical protein
MFCVRSIHAQHRVEQHVGAFSMSFGFVGSRGA